MADYATLIKDQLVKFNATNDVDLKERLSKKMTIFDTISYYKNTGGITDAALLTEIDNAQKNILDTQQAQQRRTVLPPSQAIPAPMPSQLAIQPSSAPIGMQSAAQPWGKRFLINLLDAMPSLHPAFNVNIITSEMVLNIVRFIDNKVLDVPTSKIVEVLQVNKNAVEILNTRNNLSDYDYIIEFISIIKEKSPEEWFIIKNLCYNSPLNLVLQHFGFDMAGNSLLEDFKVFFKVFPAKMYLTNIRQLLSDPYLYANIENTVQQIKGEINKTLDVIKQILQDTLTKTGPQTGGGRKPNKTRKPRKTMKRRGRGKKGTRR